MQRSLKEHLESWVFFLLRFGVHFNSVNPTPFCEMCGATAGDRWNTRPSRCIVLARRPRAGDPLHAWIICDECNEGLIGLRRQREASKSSQTKTAQPDRIHLLAQIRRATLDDQEAVLEWLLGKFKLTAQKKA